MSTAAPTPAEFLGLKDVCGRYAVSYSTVYEAVQNGDLPAEFARGRWRVDPRDVVAWLRDSDDFRTNQIGREGKP